ncbi:putative alcohol dehydrogenase [Xylariaceae sp. FL0804]|nr:putative alcohol dehydrogenase [Xylariaceae sp. FL0804]
MSPLPSTYKQAVFQAQGQALVVEQTPMKLPGAGELLVKVEACGVCHSDLFTQANAMGGGFPLCPGHEIIGRVAAVGDGGGAVAGWKVGDRVGAGWLGSYDLTCPPCKKGWYQMCDTRLVNGVTKNGGYAEYCLLKAEVAVRVPDHVDAAKYAPILCAGVSVYNSMRHMNIPVGDTVAVQGLGGLGHLAIQYARRMGYRVVAVSRGKDKEKAARELGAHEYVDASATPDVGAALRALGSASLTIEPFVTGLGVLGKLLVLSVPGALSVDTLAMLNYGLSVHSWPCGHSRDCEETIAFTELHGVDCVIEKFTLDQAQKAYDTMLDGTVRFRAVIVME